MSKATLSLLLCAVALAAPLRQAQAYWLWTPKSQSWVNPKTAVKGTVVQQFEFARSLYEAEEYEDAKREFKKLLRRFPRSKEAAESQFYLGLAEEKQGNLYEAFREFQKVIDKYPFSERIPEVVAKEYDIAEAFMTGKAKRRALGMDLPVDNPALEIFAKVVENSPFGPLAPKAHYQLGMVYKNLEQYYEAEDAFAKVVSSYPDSEWAAAAKFQIAACRALVSKGPAYDQGATREAREKFQEFLLTHPETPLSQDAEKNIQTLGEKEAESKYTVARFYERQGDYGAAEIYYNAVIAALPQSPWAARSMERLNIIGQKRKQ